MVPVPPRDSMSSWSLGWKLHEWPGLMCVILGWEPQDGICFYVMDHLISYKKTGKRDGGWMLFSVTEGDGDRTLSTICNRNGAQISGKPTYVGQTLMFWGSRHLPDI